MAQEYTLLVDGKPATDLDDLPEVLRESEHVVGPVLGALTLEVSRVLEVVQHVVREHACDETLVEVIVAVAARVRDQIELVVLLQEQDTCSKLALQQIQVLLSSIGHCHESHPADVGRQDLLVICVVVELFGARVDLDLVAELGHAVNVTDQPQPIVYDTVLADLAEDLDSD